MPQYDTIIIGMGAAGCTAGSLLSRAGKKILALEAMDRIGGRVNTMKFGNGVVELGAEWIHGTHPSRVYDLAVENNVTLMPQDLTMDVYRSDGTKGDRAIVNELIDFAMAVVDEAPAESKSLGEYITKRLTKYIAGKYPSLQHTGFLEEFLPFMDLIIDNYESSNSWNDVSPQTRYEELQGHQHMSWHRHGYKTFFEILLNKYNNGPGYPNLEIKLNTEVTQIAWPQEHTKPVVVTVKDGTAYTADNVIITVSIGVLKERHASIFSPPLPIEKIHVINDIAFGVVDKIVLSFENAWWPEQFSFFGFLWRREDRCVPHGDEWTTSIFGASCPLGANDVVTLWTSGEYAKVVETLPEDEVKQKIMGILRRFMGSSVTIPDPIGMLRSTWYSNKYTRGSYTYDHVGRNTTNSRSILAQPLLDSSGIPRVLFAGEATDDTHFSTVHGASDTGYREGMRLLPRTKL